MDLRMAPVTRAWGSGRASWTSGRRAWKRRVSRPTSDRRAIQSVRHPPDEEHDARSKPREAPPMGRIPGFGEGLGHGDGGRSPDGEPAATSALQQIERVPTTRSSSVPERSRVPSTNGRTLRRRNSYRMERPRPLRVLQITGRDEVEKRCAVELGR